MRMLSPSLPIKGNYCRLGMAYQDGRFRYNPVVRIESAAAVVSLRLFPYPIAGSFPLVLPEVKRTLDLAIYTIYGTCVRAQIV